MFCVFDVCCCFRSPSPSTYLPFSFFPCFYFRYCFYYFFFFLVIITKSIQHHYGFNYLKIKANNKRNTQNKDQSQSVNEGKRGGERGKQTKGHGRVNNQRLRIKVEAEEIRFNWEFVITWNALRSFIQQC